MRFVVHEHQSSHHHFDFRLEMSGVLKSWAVPKGPSLNPVERRLAIQVPDHSLKYGRWEGIIPEGEYGAGAVAIWDEGEYRMLQGKDTQEQWEKGNLSFMLWGKILKGGFSLLKMKGRGAAKEWLLIKKKDSYAHGGWKIETVLTPEKLSHLKVERPPCQME
jgi:bifunctional non-homologous end joining protein LigD